MPPRPQFLTFGREATLLATKQRKGTRAYARDTGTAWQYTEDGWQSLTIGSGLPTGGEIGDVLFTDALREPTFAQIRAANPAVYVSGWSATHDYAADIGTADGVQFLKPSGTTNVFVAEVFATYMTGGSEPTWNASAPTVGDTLVDGDLTWYNVGPLSGFAEPTEWATLTEYTTPAFVWPTDPNGHLYCTFPGYPSGLGPMTSNSTEPIFPTANHDYVADGDGYWFDLGTTEIPEAQWEPLAAVGLKLGSSVSAGASSIALKGSSAELVAGRYVIIDPFAATAEIRRISAVSGTAVTLEDGSGDGGYGITALQHDHASDAPVFVVDSEPIPWEWFGAVSTTSTQAVADANTAAFNNLTQQLYSINAQMPIKVGSGSWWVSDELRLERDQSLIGISPTVSQIVAHSSFVFDSTGEKAVVHGYRDGDPVTYQTNGPSGRWYLQDIMVNCNSVTDSCGILSSPQQPDQTRRVRVDNADLYGLGLSDVQYHDIHGLELNNCPIGVSMRSCSYVRIYSMAHTSTTTTMLKLVDVSDSSFYGALLENSPTGTVMVDVSGTSNRLHFDSFYTSGFTGGSTGDVFKFDCATANPEGKCTYLITNAACNQNSSTINFVNDVQRGVTFNTFADTQRGLIMGWAKGDHYHFVFDGKVVSSGIRQFVDGSNIVVGATGGTKIGTATTQKIGLHNATPSAQRAGSAQAAVGTTGATGTSPFGFETKAQADAIVTLLNELRAAMVEKGLIKGSA